MLCFNRKDHVLAICHLKTRMDIYILDVEGRGLGQNASDRYRDEGREDEGMRIGMRKERMKDRDAGIGMKEGG